VIVADVNLIAYLLIPGGRTAQAEAIFDRDPDWAVPPLWRAEFRNVLTVSGRSGLLSERTALEVMARAETLLRGQEVFVRSADVLALAFRSRCSAYDCEYIAAAQALGAPLVTADRKIVAEFPATAVSFEAFLA